MSTLSLHALQAREAPSRNLRTAPLRRLQRSLDVVYGCRFFDRPHPLPVHCITSLPLETRCSIISLPTFSSLFRTATVSAQSANRRSRLKKDDFLQRCILPRFPGPAGLRLSLAVAVAFPVLSSLAQSLLFAFDVTLAIRRLLICGRHGQVGAATSAGVHAARGLSESLRHMAARHDLNLALVLPTRRRDILKLCNAVIADVRLSSVLGTPLRTILTTRTRTAFC
ncbi:hypothetical protein C8F01DRAFT_463865 [Mycena amicta]|nr:hypothetical protein C8F01DRAFT_463865 [Mycena amicta]